MGCDIHIFVQHREGDRWEHVPFRPEDLDEYRQHPLEQRNYLLFAVLADVRSRDGVTPIAEPRGLPDDIGYPVHGLEDPCDGDLYVDLEGGRKWMGDHSHSWLTLAELEAYPWDQELPFRVTYTPTKVIEPTLKWLHSLGKPEDVRLVFGFDN